MTDYGKEIRELSDEFRKSERLLIALGDGNRQHLMLEMMQMGKCDGVRVGEITERCNLSRPAVSHHLALLKDAGIIGMRREGTKNYYYFNADCEWINALTTMLEHAKDLVSGIADGRENI